MSCLVQVKAKEPPLLLLLLLLILLIDVVSGGSSRGSTLTLPQEFEVAAKKDFLGRKQQASDKVTDHGYQEMYGMYLLPLLQPRARHVRHNRPFKMLEIGLGCDMKYGPGKSVSIWKNLLGPTDILWAAELDEKYVCVCVYVCVCMCVCVFQSCTLTPLPPSLLLSFTGACKSTVRNCAGCKEWSQQATRQTKRC